MFETVVFACVKTADSAFVWWIPDEREMMADADAMVATGSRQIGGTAAGDDSLEPTRAHSQYSESEDQSLQDVHDSIVGWEM
jgi:hypothetical protein